MAVVILQQPNVESRPWIAAARQILVEVVLVVLMIRRSEGLLPEKAAWE